MSQEFIQKIYNALQSNDYSEWKKLRNQKEFDAIDLHSVEISGLSLYNFDFSRLNLNSVNFRKGRFDDCDFSGSNLGFANFELATIENCSFRGCQLHQVDFRESDIDGCDFLNTSGLETADFHDAYVGNNDFPSGIWMDEYDEIEEDEEDFEKSLLPERVISPIQSYWEGEKLKIRQSNIDSDIKSEFFSNALESALFVLKESIDEFSSGNIDRRFVENLNNLEVLIRDPEFKKKVFLTSFKIQEIKSYYNIIEDELSDWQKSKFSAINYSVTSLLLQFEEYREFQRQIDLSNINDDIYNMGSFDKVSKIINEFISDLRRKSDVIDKDVPDELEAELLDTLGVIQQSGVAPKNRFFGTLSNIANILWNLFKPIIEEAGGVVKEGAKDGLKEATSQSVKWILGASAGFIAWLLLRVGGSFEWLGTAWNFVKLHIG